MPTTSRAPVSGACLGGQAQHFGNAEVGDLHPPLLVEQNVLGLDVAVDDAFVVRKLERLADLRDDGQRLLGRKPAGALDLPQIAAVHEFHYEVVQGARLAEVMHRDDVRMVQARQGAGFAVEPLGKARVARGGGRQDLQRHQPVQIWLARLIDGAHAALADELKDFELGKQLGEVRDWRRHEPRPFGAPGSRVGAGVEAGLHQALGAEAQRHIRRQRFVAAWANAFRFHNYVLFTCSLRNGGRRLRAKGKGGSTSGIQAEYEWSTSGTQARCRPGPRQRQAGCWPSLRALADLGAAGVHDRPPNTAIRWRNSPSTSAGPATVWAISSRSSWR